MGGSVMISWARMGADPGLLLKKKSQKIKKFKKLDSTGETKPCAKTERYQRA